MSYICIVIQILINMKTLYKISVLAVFMLICSVMQSQILYYDFENLNAGDQVAATIGNPWTTWSNAPGSAEDAAISDEYAIGNRSLKIDNGNDVMLKFGDQTTGAYKISFKMYIPEGKEGYYNILHKINETSGVNTWAFEIYFNSEEHDGTYIYPSWNVVEKNLNPFEVPYNEWFTIDTYANLDDGLIVVKVNETMLCQISYTTLTLAAIDLFPSNTTDPSKNGFYIDNITFDYWNETFVHNINLPDGNINMWIAPKEVKTTGYRIKNNGNSTGIYQSWIDFGVGGEGGETKMMNYDTDPWYNYGNYNNAPYIEIGSVFWQSNINNAGCMGTKVTKMQYFLPFSYPTTEVGCEGPITFRIYNYQTSQILAEKVVTTYYAGQWLEVEFDEPVPVTGYGLLATVGFQQIEQGYPISLDQGPSIQYKADLIRLNGGDWFSLNANAQYYGQQDFGNHNIRLICEGESIDGSWVINNSSVGYLLPDQTEWMELAFIPRDLPYGVYNATLVFVTNNDDNPTMLVPIMMTVTPESIDENTDIKYNIYPNPASDVINIDGYDLNCVVIYNSIGQIVDIVKIDNNSLNTSKLSPGVYYLNIINNKGARSIKQVVIAR